VASSAETHQECALDIEALLFRASSAEERYLLLGQTDARTEFHKSDHHKADDKLAWWSRELRWSAEQILANRAAELRTKPEHIRHLFGLSKSSCAMPDETMWQKPFLSIIESLRTADKPQSDPAPNGLEVFGQPWCRELDRAINEGYGNTPRRPDVDIGRLQKAAQREFRKSFNEIAARTLTLELHVAREQGALTSDTPEARFREFCDHLQYPEYCLKIIEEYPVLHRALCTEIAQLTEMTVSVCDALAHYWDAICHTFPVLSRAGKVVDISYNAGDKHARGHAVSVITFDTEDRLVYKPRSLSVDRIYNELVDYLNDHGLEVDLRTCTTLDCGDYGWVEYLEPASVTSEAEISRFYCRLGETLALIHDLAGSDFHCENIFAVGQYPILLDLECLFFRHLRDSAESGPSLLTMAARKILLATAMLPARPVGGVDGADFSGVSQIEGLEAPIADIGWSSTGTDEVRVERRRGKMRDMGNVPKLNGSSCHARDYEDEIVKGWRSAAALLDDLKSDAQYMRLWQKLRELHYRYVPVQSWRYAKLLKESYHPNLLRDGLDRDALFDDLWRMTRPGAIKAALCRSARRDLWNNSIPYFEVVGNLDEAVDTSGVVISDPGTGDLDLVEVPRRDLNRDKLHHEWVLRQSLRVDEKRRRPNLFRVDGTTDPVLPLPQRCLVLAEQLGVQILDVAYREYGQMIFADVLELVDKGKKRHYVDLQQVSVYDGLGGMLIFFAELSVHSSNPRFAAAVGELRKCLDQACNRMPESHVAGGAFSGVASCLYTCAFSGDTELASFLIRAIQVQIAKDKSLDVIDGAAGIILAALAYYETSRDRAALDLAVRAGDHLVTSAQIAGDRMAWYTIDDKSALGGFAHGSAGIAAALFRLASVTDQGKYLSSAEQALCHDRGTFSAEVNNWRDLRSWAKSEDSVAWCYGAPGTALARLVQSKAGYHDGTIDSELAIAFERISAYECSSDVLCHGTFGNIDVLNSMVERVPNESWAARRTSYVENTLARIAQTGCRFDGTAESLNLMLGYAGIGYALLRCAHPDRVPSILSVDPPYRGAVDVACDGGKE
jgi:type 2 lantibiotic biosynthesis protein LanM